MRMLFLLTFIPLLSFASIKVGEINIDCLGDEECENYQSSLSFLKRDYVDKDHLQETVKLYVLNEGISHFGYALVENQGKYSLDIDLKVKKILLNYGVYLDKDPGIDLPGILPLREGDFVDDRVLAKTRSLLLDVLEKQGYPQANLNYKIVEKDDGVEIDINLFLGKEIEVDKLTIISDSSYLEDISSKTLSRFKGKNFHLQKIKNSAEEMRQLFIDYGYYLNEITVEHVLVDNYSAEVKVTIKNNGLHVFHARGNKFIEESEIKRTLRNTVLAYKRELSADTVASRLEGLYSEKGFVKAKVEGSVENYKDINGDKVIRYNLDIDEKARPRVEKISFNGNSSFSSNALRRLYYESAPPVANAGYLNKEYVDVFPELMREQYIAKGFVNIFIEEPRIYFSGDKVFLNFRVREGVKAIVSSVRVDGVPEIMEQEFKDFMDNRSGSNFNPLTFKQDLEMIENRLRQQGFYYAKILNKNAAEIVQYKNQNSNVDIKIEVSLGKRLFAGQIIIIGNRQTRSSLIRREITFKSGDLVTRDKIQNSQTNLLGLGIFSSVLIEPVESVGEKSDILISVREKDFGLVELAPGIRTDLGVKISANVTYNNIDGMNKRISFKGQVNQRFNLNSLDERRRQESNSLIEYDLAVNYAENHIFRSDFDFSSSLSRSRRRFFSFDADIQRVNFTINREFAPWFSASLRPQFENIQQFDATSELDEGTFTIGSLTPSITMDFRNNRINPTSGSWFNLSVEVANPAIGSQENEDLTIDYYKLVSRNRFYIPFKNGTIAMSLVGGLQENLADPSEGYIPNIKVFRLNGVDIVRGYEDDEINRLPNSDQDISEVRIDEKAYMAVLKFEPRIFLSDTTMLGVFYDAGRVFVNEFEQDELRSSVGLTFKYLTPVGSLDFDYGIKLLRKTYDDGKVDSPGRLHVSIGFF